MIFGPFQVLFWKIMLEIRPQIHQETHFYQPLQNYRAEISATWKTHDMIFLGVAAVSVLKLAV
jgi:hypothetical protein